MVSLPARGAWIEMDVGEAARRELPVAPREGSVDRNIPSPLDVIITRSRSPRGERG